MPDDAAAVQRQATAPVPSSASARGLPSTARGVLIRRLRGRILEAAARYGASNVRLFGSTARGDDGPGSDIDFLVQVRPGVGLFGLFRLQEELERLLDAPVDVIPDEGLKPRVRPAVERDLIPL